MNNTLFFIAIACAIIGEILYLTVTGFHPNKEKIIMTCLFVASIILAYFFPLYGLILAGLLIIYNFVRFFLGQSKIKENPEDWIPYQDFEASFKDDPKEMSGCYVMTVFPSRLDNQDFGKYEVAYVGGNPQLKKEIHKVLNHQTLSRAYRDIQEGKQIYIRMIPTEVNEINATQQKLIEKYHAVPYLLSFKEVKEKAPA